MNVSELQKDLIALLKALNLKETQVIGIMLALKKEKQQDEMIQYIIDNKKIITEEMIMEKLEQILQS